MKSIALVRLFVIGLVAAILLSLLSLISLKKLVEYGSNEHRRYFVLSIANRIEERPLTVESLQFFSPKNHPPFGPPPGFPGFGGGKFDPPGGPGFMPPFPPPPGFEPIPGQEEESHNNDNKEHRERRRHGDMPPPFAPPPGAENAGDVPPGPPPVPRGGPFPPRLNLWLVTENGDVISSNTEKKLPPTWMKVGLPKEAHEISSSDGLFRLASTSMIVKLDTRPPAYLVAIQDEESYFSGPVFASQAILTFVTVCIAIFFSLFFTFMYLRRKSLDAKSVLLRLERGDLKARFEIKRMDEFGNLMLDFNRMANEIERLVHRIHETEKSRKNLLQELGHDLRTPLTGLTTAFETLKIHFHKINEEDREELFKIMGGEITYLRDLLEKLLTIATLDEPHYKTSTESIDLEDLLAQEVQSRQGASETLAWNFQSKVSQTDPGVLLGDPHLIMRLLRNGLDNAAKYAGSKVDVSLVETASSFEILINDDGPGINAQGIESFGKRKDYRARAVSGLHYSIGLGSVIMKTVAELHGGTVEIRNRADLDSTRGASVLIVLPKTA